MVQATTVFMAVLTFCFGLILGLLLHLPGASSPDGILDRLQRHNRNMEAHKSHVNTDVLYHPKALTFKSKASELDLSEVSLEGLDIYDEKQTETNVQQFTSTHQKNNFMSSSQLANINNDILPREDNRDSGRLGLGLKDDIFTVTDSQQYATIAKERQNSNPVTRTVTVKVNIPQKSQFMNSDENPNIPNNRSVGYELKVNSSIDKSSSNISDVSPSVDNILSIVNGVYWTTEAEAMAPKGFTTEETTQWYKRAQNNQIIGLNEGCGRMQNRQLVMSDATKACARYRLNTDQIQGEIYSYYLSRVLNITHVPPSVLMVADPQNDQWRRVNQALVTAQWSPDKVIIVTPWVEGLQSAYIPQELQTDDRKLHPTVEILKHKTPEDIKELVQWSDLIILDYLTANLDRVVNNMYNHQWNPDMMKSPAHNLEKDSRTGSLLFIDNESGLFHSYRLLDKYASYHKSLLKSLCIFRKNTAEKIKEFHSNGQIGVSIMDMFRREDVLHQYVPRLPSRTVSILEQRLLDVHHQIQYCQTLYNS